MSEFKTSQLPLGKHWQENTKRAMICLMAMAHYALVTARGWAVNSGQSKAPLRTPPTMAIRCDLCSPVCPAQTRPRHAADAGDSIRGPT